MSRATEPRREEGEIPPHADAGRGVAGWIGVYLRGMAMGVAELVPGVSGGTIAFITGIYVELVRSIRSLTPGLVARALRGRLVEAWREGNVGFLAILGLGMVTSVLLFASVVAWFLEHREILLWAFFFGLIVASAIYVGRFARPWNRRRVALAAAGLGAGALLANVQPLPAPEHWISTVLAGAVAICAWILPGISGSFVLLLLGQYPPLVRALNEFDLVFLSALAAGCVAGLLAFARVLMWLLRNWYEATLAFLCGFMAGSLQKLWPWRETVTSYVDEDGRLVPLIVRPISPRAWETATGLDPMVFGDLVAAALAVAVVLALEVVSRQRGSDRSGTGFGAGPPTS
jgi:putative membrane protein